MFFLILDMVYLLIDSVPLLVARLVHFAMSLQLHDCV